MRINRPSQSGFSMVELLVSLGLFGLLCLVALSNLNVLENPLVSSTASLSHYFRLVRVRAIAQTRSIKVTPDSATRLSASTAANCSATTFTPLSDLTFDLGDDVSLGSIDWSGCFNQRGLANQSVLFTLQSASGSNSVEVALGGGVEIQ